MQNMENIDFEMNLKLKILRKVSENMQILKEKSIKN